MLCHAGETPAVEPDAPSRPPDAWPLPTRPHRTWTDLILPAADAAVLLVVLELVGRTGWPGVAYGGAAFAILAVAGCQRLPLAPELCQEAPRLVGMLAAPVVPLGLVAGARPEMSALLRVLPLAVALVVLDRALIFRVLQSARLRGRPAEPVLVIGSGRVAVDLVRMLQAHPEYGLRPIGFLDTPGPCESLPLPLLGRVRDLDAVLDRFGVRRVVIAFGHTPEWRIVEILRACRARRVEIHVVPRFFELGADMATGPGSGQVWGIPVLPLPRSAPHRPMWAMKRVFDVMAAAVLLVATAPLFGAVALAVRLSSPGPVFFRQKRVGQEGKVIEIVKFRTLRMNESSDILWTPDIGTLVTPIGRFLRATSLDELPQLLNVLRGDMSLVGPRPERPYFVRKFGASVPQYAERHRVPVGITGLSQINGLRGDTSIEDRTRFDNFYIEHWSLWRDFTILVRTASVFLGRSAR